MKKISLSVKVILALSIGTLLGIIFRNNESVVKYIEPFGTIYISLIKLIMIPLVFTSLTLGMTNIDNKKKVGKMGVVTIITFLFTTGIAVILGLIGSSIFKPGVGMVLSGKIDDVNEYPDAINTFLSIVPSNIVQAMSEGKMLQIILISIILGIGLSKVGKKGEKLYELIDSIYNTVIVITKGIIEFTPIGIVGLMVPTVANNGLNVLFPLIKVILVFYLMAIIHLVFVYGGIVKGFTKYSVIEFEKAIFPVQMLAFSSCSSAATLPVSYESAQNELHISKEVSSFVLPLGTTINMDGNALYQGIVALFIAQAYGVHMTIPMQFMVVTTGILASIGAAGVPGAGVIVLSTVLMSVGLPVEGVALIAGIDRILDMGRSMINVTGDIVTAAVVQKVLDKT